MFEKIYYPPFFAGLHDLCFNQSQLLNPFESLSLEHLLDAASSITCPENDPIYKCCNSLQNLKLPEKLLLLDNSGTVRQPGLQLGDWKSDGMWLECKRLGYNYCKYSSSPFHNVLHCLPPTCEVESLNAYLDLIADDESLIFPVVETANSSYSYCYDKKLLNESYEWYFILFIILAAGWSIFVLFSPYKPMNINTIMGDLTKSNTKQKKFTDPSLRSLNGLRVLSLCWVIGGHVFLELAFAWPSNILEIVDTIVSENPNMIWIVNGTVSVDNFFVMGGLLTGYLMKRYFDKHQKYSWTAFFIAVLNRTLRLMPTIGAAIALAMMFFGHQGGITESKLAHLDRSFGYQEKSPPYAQVQFCKNGWYWTMLNLFWAIPSSTINESYCFGHLWYISCDYWFYIIGLLIMKVCFTYGRKIGFILATSIAILSQICSLIILFLIRGEWYIILLTKKTPGHNNPYSDMAHLEAYGSPWCRIAPYLMGLMVGYILVDKRDRISNKEINKESAPFIPSIDNWKRSLKLLVCVVGLAGVMYFPYPQYVEVYYPYWIGVCYSTVHRQIWSFFLVSIIYLIETYRSGWIYNILSSNYWNLPAKINFSVYVIHYILLPWITENFAFQQYYFTPLFAILMNVGYTLIIYFMGLIFYVLVEHPIGLASKTIIARLVDLSKNK